jgi:membrane protease YdiL (CAAX protease family)
VLPFVYFASTTAPFQAYYPQFKGVISHSQVHWEHVLCFELVYALLFISGESFWRGYMIFGLEERLGYHGILFMVVPYVMSHYEKPFFESMGAIVTGLVLGYLALKHRNFWLGVVVHWSVAILMDMLALKQLGVEII